MLELRSMLSVRMNEPNRRAETAVIASSKNSQTCPPRPERDRSRAAHGTPREMLAPLPAIRPYRNRRPGRNKSHPEASDKHPRRTAPRPDRILKDASESHR